MTKKRTFGWIQNPGRLDTLRNVVACLYPSSRYNQYMRRTRLPLLWENDMITRENYDSFEEILSRDPLVVPYPVLRGTGGKNRREALCDGIIQAAIDGQQDRVLKDGRIIKKPYTQDWSAEGYLRWAVSTGLLLYDEQLDECRISPLGSHLVEAMEKGDGDLARQYMAEALLSYPPCIRILNLLKDEKPHTKYDLGSHLGFRGEMGFTSIPQAVFVASWCLASDTEKKKIRNNMEGDSDKYARMICSWLKQMGWVENTNVTVSEKYRDQVFSMNLPAWTITLSGLQALKRANGYSRYPQIPKRVFWEMLATKGPDAPYLRCRRTALIQVLRRSARTVPELMPVLQDQKIPVSDSSVIRDDLDGLERIGLYVQSDAQGRYRVKDTIECLENRMEVPETGESRVAALKDRIRARLRTLDHDYLIMVDLAYSDKANKAADALKFEAWTAKLFGDLAMNGLHLGGADKPDVLASYGHRGIIVDNKSYQNGFNVDKHCEDEMRRYVVQNQMRQPHMPANEWWKNFGPDVTEFYYLFVTSYLTGNFQSNLEELSFLGHTCGGAVGIEDFLYLADDIMTGTMDPEAFFGLFQNNEIKASKRP